MVPVYEVDEDDGEPLHRDALRGGDRPAHAHRRAGWSPTRAAAIIAQVAVGARRRARSRAGAPRHQARQRAGQPGERAGPRVPDRLRPRRSRPPHRTASPAPANGSGPSTTSRPSRSRARAWTRAATSTRSSCVLYEALTGRVPYPRDSEVAKMFAHINDPPPSLAEMPRPLPPGLDEVVSRGMAKKAGERYPSAGDLGRAALAASQGLETQGAERSVARGDAAPAGATVISPGTPTAEGARRHRGCGHAGGADAAPRRGAAAAPAARAHRRGGRGARGAGRRGRAPDVSRAGTSLLPARVGWWAPPSRWAARPRRSPSARDRSGWRTCGATTSRASIPARASRMGRPIPVGGQPYGVAVGEGAVWVVLFKDGSSAARSTRARESRRAGPSRWATGRRTSPWASARSGWRTTTATP